MLLTVRGREDMRSRKKTHGTDATDGAWSRRYAVAKEDTRHCWLDTGEDGGRRVIIVDTLETVADANEDTRRS
jgi:hypothetical protein